MKGKKSVRELKHELDPAPEVRHLRERVKLLEAQVKRNKVDQGRLDAMLQEIVSVVPRRPAPAPAYTPPTSTVVTSPCSVVAHLTDLHIGGVQPASEIEGFNAFSPTIARLRLERYGKKVLDWVQLHRRSYRLDELVMVFTGDNVSGDIHEELRRTNAWPLPVQCVAAAHLIADLVLMVCPHFATVRVEFLCSDNHGRLTHKPQARECGTNSYNYIIAGMLKQALGEVENVELRVHTASTAVVQVSGRRYLILHGHEVRGWAGFPYYGIERRAAKEAMARQNMAELRRFHRILMGHFHAPLTHPHYLIGGSLSGTDAYDHSQGRHAPPCQRAWIVHPVHGEFDWYEVLLASDDEPWSEVETYDPAAVLAGEI